MLFQPVSYHIYKSAGKEQDSSTMTAQHTYSPLHSILGERASTFTSKASITLEAAVVIPIFFFAMLCMVYLFEILAIQTAMQSALQSVGREMAEKVYLVPYISAEDMEENLITILGREKLDQSIISEGAEGLDCSQSRINLLNDCIDLYVRYQVEIPVLLFRLPIRTYEERLRVKGWTGYSESLDSSLENTLVYVTDYGLVYHKRFQCGYLELTIRNVAATSVGTLRNQSGGKYSPCEKCRDNPMLFQVYITDYGNRYHTTLDCQGLKRNIRMMRLKDVNGLGGCSKCVN